MIKRVFYDIDSRYNPLVNEMISKEIIKGYT